MRKLGSAQQGCLEAIESSFTGRWNYHKHNGWEWGTPSQTDRIFESLAKRGRVLRVAGIDYATFYAIRETGTTNAVVSDWER